MSTYVLDTSVAMAWYLPEDVALAARVYRDRLATGAIRCLVPGLHFWEFGNVLRTRVLRGELEPTLAREILELHLDADLDVAEPDRAHAFDVALEFEATVYDAVYIALALEHDVQLLTAEKTTRPWVTRLANRAVHIRSRPVGADEY